MKFGCFDDEKKEYVIETPYTPLPWINYLGNDGFFSLISNTGGGYCFYKDARLRRIIRYRYNNPAGDIGGRFFYIKEEGKKAWSPAFLPAGTELDTYRCRHGLGYTVFEAKKDELSSHVTLTVPRGENVELQLISLKNNSDEIKKIRLWAGVEWCLWDAGDDAENYQRNLNIGECEIGGGIIYHKTEYRERRDHYAFYGTSHATQGFDTDREAFTGRFGGWEDPYCVEHEKSADSLAVGWYPVAIHRIDLTLMPGQSEEIVFVLGYAENPREQKFLGSPSDGIINKERAAKIMERYAAPDAVREALRELNTYWSGLLKGFQISSNNKKIDRMANIWNQYQCMVTFNMSRSASFFESGMGRGMGFRDSCQDIQGFVHMEPERARGRIIDIASVQRADGSTYHQYQPLTKKGNSAIGSGFNDDPLWLIAAVAAYIKETGDNGVLDAMVPFDCEPGSEATLLEHLKRSIDYTLSHLGPHSLPLIGHADWNDCLNLNCFSENPGESFQCLSPADEESSVAESLLIAGMFVLYGREYASMCKRWGKEKEAKRVETAVSAMERAIIDYGWDGEWYLRAYDAGGDKVGSASCDEGKIFLEPQCLCSMAKVGKEQGMPERSLKSTARLLCSDIGYELLTPPYTSYHKELGEITSYPPGYKENGSVFCQTNPWLSIAAALNGDKDMAWDAYRCICPAYLEEISEIHRTEPYVYCQMIAGRYALHPGEAKNSWLSATSAWAWTALSQYILGVRPEYDGLRINPMLPADMGDVVITKRWRGALYRIHLINKGCGADVFIPFEEDRREYDIEIEC